MPTKVRNQVRKSLKTYDFRKVSKDEMSGIGFELFNKSRERFHNDRLFATKEGWLKSLSRDNLDFWMGFDRETGKAASFAINTVYKDYCDYNTMGISPDFPNNTYPMYGLIYEMNRYYLYEMKLYYVLDGARSVTEHSNIQSVLIEKFRFRKAYCDLQVFYKTWVWVTIKLLYPFKAIINNSKIKTVLKLEAMARGEY